MGRLRGLGRLGRMRGKSKKNVNIFLPIPFIFLTFAENFSVRL